MSQEELQHLRHSLAHLLAAAVLDLYPDAKRTIGPAIDDGFYYDFAFGGPISEEDLPKIEAKMRELLPTFSSFDREEVTADEARKVFADNKYKLELIDEFSGEGQSLTLYRSGNYVDLCRGGHADSLADVDPASFKLAKLAGAYWRGDEKNDQLTRIYGLAFATKEELEKHIAMLEEAKKRDHKRLGPELDLFVFSDLVGSGLPLWTPRGTLLRNTLDDFVWRLRKARGYDRVEIPHITKKDLYVTSGHWDKYKDDLFKITTREGHEFAMKPMNCPHHTQIYARRQWSYRELPQRYANTTTCYRDEQSGELAGLSRVRAFAQDDAHVFCRISQAKEEIQKIWEIVHTFYGAFGLDLKLRLSLRDPEHPEKYLGNQEHWDRAEAVLREVAAENKTEFFEGLGEAAFYAPKLDFMAEDSLGRKWQVATIQLDVNMPERFDLSCINEKGDHERIVMIHAAIMGSIERFLSIIIEHLGGAFPMWLAPEQIRIATVAEDYVDAAQAMKSALEAAGLRVALDDTNEKVGKKIRGAAMQKVPWTIVVGGKEKEGGDISVKVFGSEEQLVIEQGKLVDAAVVAGAVPRV
ncbi:MAG: Threonine-tRNA ligase [Candidatus Uhrbacteria bacterium GW2011_GWD2_52_7]|uniref:Threonine--tRNA ligase n=1 Tax=Candidatus Uhrbacteria bacterium GW2011_GWD2_52_7 TaxID=1618989 RepID=A0A0G1XGZ6_9BACT|nr:MAG: Threonine-tRNA ligase [Candidatus Uhrbacteria bacterium GW2011_GWD2_52_7]